MFPGKNQRQGKQCESEQIKYCICGNIIIERTGRIHDKPAYQGDGDSIPRPLLAWSEWEPGDKDNQNTPAGDNRTQHSRLPCLVLNCSRNKLIIRPENRIKILIE